MKYLNILYKRYVQFMLLGGRWSLGAQQQTVPQGPLKR